MTCARCGRAADVQYYVFPVWAVGRYATGTTELCRACVAAIDRAAEGRAWDLEEVEEMREIELGDGKVLVGSVRDSNGHSGIVLRPVAVARAIDQTEPDWKDGEEFIPEEGDVVIWFKTMDGARVLQDRVAIACLQMNRFQVRDLAAHQE